MNSPILTKSESNYCYVDISGYSDLVKRIESIEKKINAIVELSNNFTPKQESIDKRFNAGYVYKCLNGYSFLVLDANNPQNCYCLENQSLYLTNHVCLDISTGKKWEPME